MSFQAQPTIAGTYRVKVYNSGTNLYWKYISDGTHWIKLATVEENNDQFKWNIAPLSGTPNVFTIRPASDPSIALASSNSSTNNTGKYWGYGFAEGRAGSPESWNFKKNVDGKYSKVKIDGLDYVLDCRDTNTNCVHFYQDQNSENQRFVFQLVQGSNPPVKSKKTFEDLWFQLTPEKAATETYDIIVIGTGMGGGVIAADLFETNSKVGGKAKSVLVIEKGGVPFHSHCLNASRPSGYGEDRGQQNDTFFALFKEDYQFKDQDQSKLWKAGPMFNIGGRGAAWGLFAPRIHDKHLEDKFGTILSKELVDTWYREAEGLMDLSLPLTNTIHQNIMERLNIKTKKEGCQWQWGRIASEFNDSKNFDFATGAYSTIDKILEIAMSKKRNADGTCVEHPNWKILINTEARSIIWDDNEEKAVGVVLRDANGKETKIFLKKDSSGKVLADTQIVVGAGSVGSPAILMRSGQAMKDILQNPRNNALHLTDHDILARAFTFSYRDPSIRKKVGAMKLQSYVHLKSGESNKIALVNLAIDSSSFLPRQNPPENYLNQDFPKLIVAIILPTDLNQKNTIDLDAKGEPVLNAARNPPPSEQELEQLRDFTKTAILTITEALQLELHPADPKGEYNWSPEDSDGKYNWVDDKFFNVLELGAVAHELGTIPLKCYDCDRPANVTSNLELVSRKGVYVCDLSIFPFSPEVNPTLTLVALALRLSRNTLHRRIPLIDSDKFAIYVMNQTGDSIKVFVSNLAGAVLTTEEVEDNKNGGKVLGPGDVVVRPRRVGGPNKAVDETVMVYRLRPCPSKAFLPNPIPYIAKPGVIRAIE